MSIPLAIIVHGGAWYIPAKDWEAHKTGCQAAAIAGFEVLGHGGSALDAVERAIVYLEDDPTFDAGVGAHLNQEGAVQLDAGMMDGHTYQVGAVAAIERVKNPIRVARRLLSSEHNMFAGSGAMAYAQACGIPLCDPVDLVVARERTRWLECQKRGEPPSETVFVGGPEKGTVGAVAIDREGNIVAGTSTGGTPFKPAGRVGDSPLPGCGYYADNALAGVSVTGHGEAIIRVQLARTAADFCAKLSAQSAAEAAMHMLSDRVAGKGGLILIDHTGQVGYAYNTSQMARAFMVEGMDEPEVGI
ncbi:MAG: isoaspartyl peptidase/L-asparaginase family protein [Anaerolineae bacterium]|jgi:beta-aspartyl-peptidase (threonine type)